MTQKIYPRALDFSSILASRSCFFLGPRLTGKSTLIRESIPEALVFDLLKNDVYFALVENSFSLENVIPSNTEIVVIDEVQKAPQLLDEVHRLIELKGIRFLLTGSSARKLRRGGVNLLGGRAGTVHFHPFIARELGDDFRLNRALRYGTLPAVYCSDEPSRVLQDYVGNYLRQEIAAEGFVRNLPAFMRFIDVASHCNATIVNYENLANDAQVSRNTVYNYFDILKDTLVAFELPAWRNSYKRKPIVSSKYYFFDIGVATAIQSRSAFRFAQSEGFSFETWILHELRSWIDYNERDDVLHYWRSRSGYEVDFLIHDHTAIEVKAKPHVGVRDLRSLRALKEEEIFQNFVCVCMGSLPMYVDGIEILPYMTFLDYLWEGKYG
ncbi:MAG: ATP-binding protein [Gammaproteobacteria bacterium]|nr:ATP-binding protein [Gammaproteobacteria bacterium]